MRTSSSRGTGEAGCACEHDGESGFDPHVGLHRGSEYSLLRGWLPDLDRRITNAKALDSGTSRDATVHRSIGATVAEVTKS